MNRDVLILYSQKDDLWKKQVEKHIGVLVKSGFDFNIDLWSEPRTDTTEWYTGFQASLDRSGAIVLLLSERFLDSRLMQSEKVRNRLKVKQEGGFPLFIVLVGKCPWKRYPWMKALPTQPKNGKFLSDLSSSAIESSLADLAKQIAKVLKLETQVTEGILSYLQVNAIGPVKQLQFEPGRRLNIITGDNAFGKTLLLECAWWALSGIWSKYLFYPRDDAGTDDAVIRFQLMSKSGNTGEIESISYDWDKQQWPRTGQAPYANALVVYAGINGSFAVWDPVKAKIPPPVGASKPSSPLLFDREKVNEGIKENIPGKTTRHLCNGLVTDLVSWQRDPDSPFGVLTNVLKQLSTGSQEPLTPGPPVRVPGTTLEFPSLQYPYGTVPFIHSASSVQRIVSLAYILVWLWKEHKIACKETRKNTYKNMVVLIDEVESHLHPQWQRTIIPSLLEVGKYLEDELNIQFLITTHSPLALASLEPVFEEENDKLFHLVNIGDKAAVLKKQSFLHHGRVDNWFTSETFGLSQARSLEAEKAIQDAKAIQQKEKPTTKEIEVVHKRLLRFLGDCDTFWSRWTFFAEQHGVDV